MENYGVCKQCQSPCHPLGDLCDNCANQLEPTAFHPDGMLDEQAEADKLWLHECGLDENSRAGRDLDIECYINVYKSKYGRRPRHIDFDVMSDDELNAAIKAI